MNSADLPAREIDHLDSKGYQVRAKCAHDLIPGLDADFCPVCRIWWVDRQMRDRYLPRRKTKTNNT